jgi:hypothetical protein
VHASTRIVGEEQKSRVSQPINYESGGKAGKITEYRVTCVLVKSDSGK